MRPWLTHPNNERPSMLVAAEHATARAVVPAFALAILFACAMPTHAQTVPTDASPDPTIAATSQAPLPADAATEPAAPAPRPRAHVESSRSATAASHAPAASPVSAPADLRRVSDWVAYQAARHLSSLPTEARVFYRRGLMARQTGQVEEALADVRGAAELDPTFVEPHLTLAAWMLTREPSQALQQYAVVVELLRQNFNLQLGLAANAFLIGFQALYVGLLLACMILVWLRRDELTHAWRERLSKFASGFGARWWATAVLALPFLAGFGLTLPTLAFLAYLWPNLRVRERVLGVLLLFVVLATPPALRLVERFSLPLHEQAAPFYDVPQLESAAWSEARETRLRQIAASQPDNGIVQFGLAWTARRGPHLDAAEHAYREVTRIWPRDDRAFNNLGNVLAMSGRNDEALAAYTTAVQLNPANAGAYFNAAQLHTQRFEYAAATEALSRASALNFELVRTYQAQATTDGLLPLIDEWLTPDVFWRTLRSAPIPAEMAGAVPLALRRNVEAAGWPFSIAALLLVALSLAAGVWQHRRLHLRVCSNCDGVVCRRCAERRRELALCPTCAGIESRAETAEFGRVLLQRHRHDRLRQRRLVQTALAALIPGYGLIAHRRVFSAVFLLSLSWLVLLAWPGTPVPFAIEPRLTLPGDEVPSVVLWGSMAIVYAASLLGYLHHSEKARAREASLQGTTRGRVTQSTRRVLHTAA